MVTTICDLMESEYIMQQTNWRERLQYGSGTNRETERLRQEALALKNRRTGINLFQVSWIMVFVCLVIVHWQIRTTSAAWPPAGVEKLSPFLPTLATLGLLVSTGFIYRARRAIQTDDVKSFLVQSRATLGLGGLFIAVIAFEWLRLPPVPEEVVRLNTGLLITAPTTLYNTVFRVMTGFHMVHALAIGGYLWWVQRRAAAGFYGSQDSWDVEAGAKLWYFVVVAWIMFYAALYLM
jgi:heme/copper-type cytochrome/quinol oxidase subunit 3